MKKTSFLFFIVTIFLSTNCLMSAVHTINTSKSGILPNQRIGTRLNDLVKAEVGTAISDTTTIIINFDTPGKYYFDNSLITSCNTVIDAVPGVTLEIPVNFNFTDDCMFGFHGGKVNGIMKKVSASVSNLTIKLADHTGILWLDKPAFIFKLFYSDGINFNNVKTFLNNALCTNLDMRVCSNINISDCEFENYNNCKMGGVLWMRGNTENVKVYNNKFRKYGNDEIIAIWGNNTISATDPDVDCNVIKKNIDIYNNDIYYGYFKSDKANIPIDRLLYIYTNQPDQPGGSCQQINFNIENINIRSNNFIIDDPVKYNISVLFDPLTSASNINIENNNISYSKLCTDTVNGYIVDFDIINENKNNDFISICNNKIYSEDLMKNNYGNRPHICLNSGVAKTVFKNNTVSSINGITLFNVSIPESESNIILSDNICNGLQYMGILSSSDSIKYININAYNNSFEGDTRIYSRVYQGYAANANFVFRNNNFYSNNDNFFMQNFARKGNVVFENNYIKMKNDSSNYGRFYSYYDSIADPSVFNKLIIRNNTFYNISSSLIYSFIKKCDFKAISGNLYKEGLIEPECNCDKNSLRTKY